MAAGHIHPTNTNQSGNPHARLTDCLTDHAIPISQSPIGTRRFITLNLNNDLNGPTFFNARRPPEAVAAQCETRSLNREARPTSTIGRRVGRGRARDRGRTRTRSKEEGWRRAGGPNRSSTLEGVFRRIVVRGQNASILLARRKSGLDDGKARGGRTEGKVFRPQIMSTA